MILGTGRTPASPETQENAVPSVSAQRVIMVLFPAAFIKNAPSLAALASDRARMLPLSGRRERPEFRYSN